ncbi:hypothetical protein ACFRLW_43965, partial [Streptomyces sp. NPDC056728]
PVQLQKPPVPDVQPAAAPGHFLADALSTSATTAVPDPVLASAADGDFVAEAWGLKLLAADRATPPQRPRPRPSTTRRWDSGRPTNTT